MNKTPRQKMGKRARRELDASARRTWHLSPVTRTKPSKKIYDRKKRRADEDSFPALSTSSKVRAGMI